MTKSKQNQVNHIALSVLGDYSPEAIGLLIKWVTQADCQILDSNFSKLGEKLGGFILIAGFWHQLAKFEHGLEQLGQDFNLKFQVQRTDRASAESSCDLVYSVYGLARDEPGMIDAMIGFFAGLGVTILEAISYVHSARYTGTQMLTMSLLISLAAEIDVADLRDQFALLCDDLNIDGMIEIER